MGGKNMNIVHYKGHDYFNYMKYYNPNDVNVFIGGRRTGKTFSFMHSKYRYEVNEFEYHYSKQGGLFTWCGEFGDDYKRSLIDVPIMIGSIYSCIAMEDFLSVKREVFPHEVTHTIE